MEDLYRRKYAQAVTAEERSLSGVIWNRYELARGRPGKGPPLPAEWSEVQRQNLAVLDALFADGDSSQGARAARALERQLGIAFAASDRSALLARYAVGQYALYLGNLTQVRRAIADLRQATPHADSTWQADEPRAYALLLEAQLASREHSLAAAGLLGQLDSVLANPRGPCSTGLTPHSSRTATWWRRNSTKMPVIAQLLWPPFVVGLPGLLRTLHMSDTAARRAGWPRSLATLRVQSALTATTSHSAAILSPGSGLRRTRSEWSWLLSFATGIRRLLFHSPGALCALLG